MEKYIKPEIEVITFIPEQALLDQSNVAPSSLEEHEYESGLEQV